MTQEYENAVDLARSAYVPHHGRAWGNPLQRMANTTLELPTMSGVS